MRAAVVGELAETRQRWATESNLAANHTLSLDVAAILLPPGVHAGAVGRTALAPHTPEWRAAGLGMPQRVALRLPNWCAQLVTWAGHERLDGGPPIPGPIDIPVWADPSTRQIVRAADDVLVSELAAWRDHGVALWRKTEGSPVGAALGRRRTRHPRTPGRLGRSRVARGHRGHGR